MSEENEEKHSKTNNVPENEPSKEPKRVEPTISTLEREILLRSENRKGKTLQLPTIGTDLNTDAEEEQEIVGDDTTNTTTNITCECDQPGVAGAAVPLIASLTKNNSDELSRTEKNRCLVLRNSPSINSKHTDEEEGEGEEIETEGPERAIKNDVDDFKKLTQEFCKQVSKLAEEVPRMSPAGVSIDNLYKHVTNLKKLAMELKNGSSDDRKETENLKTTGRDNKRIYIKFLSKKRCCTAETQTDGENDLDRLELERELSPDEYRERDSSDCMDGMFIPCYGEPLIQMDEDDDIDDGLDITITFPELHDPSNLHEENSQLSVHFSTISAEALGHLKRCPKEFTLRMDFVQGKMFLQSAKSLANNCAMGADLTITECVVDNKESDIISIKPSTECLYASQIIPVEGAVTKESIKILKSTDSELFSVVSGCFVSRRNSTVTKSCMEFEDKSPTAIFGNRTYYKSMEERVFEKSTSQTALIKSIRKPRNRCL